MTYTYDLHENYPSYGILYRSEGATKLTTTSRLNSKAFIDEVRKLEAETAKHFYYAVNVRDLSSTPKGIKLH